MRYKHTTDCRNCGRPLVALLAEWSFRVLWSHARKQKLKGLVKWAQDRGPLCPPCLATFADAPLHRKSVLKRPSDTRRAKSSTSPKLPLILLAVSLVVGCTMRPDRWGIPLLGEASMFSTITCILAAFFVACLSALLWLASRAPDDELG